MSVTRSEVIQYDKKHPFYKDTPYFPNARFRKGRIVCRIERVHRWIYRVVFYSSGTVWGFSKCVFSEGRALKLRDRVFARPTDYGFNEQE